MKSHKDDMQQSQRPDSLWYILGSTWRNGFVLDGKPKSNCSSESITSLQPDIIIISSSSSSLINSCLTQQSQTTITRLTF